MLMNSFLERGRRCGLGSLLKLARRHGLGLLLETDRTPGSRQIANLLQRSTDISIGYSVLLSVRNRVEHPYLQRIANSLFLRRTVTPP